MLLYTSLLLGLTALVGADAPSDAAAHFDDNLALLLYKRLPAPAVRAAGGKLTGINNTTARPNRPRHVLQKRDIININRNGTEEGRPPRNSDVLRNTESIYEMLRADNINNLTKAIREVRESGAVSRGASSLRYDVADFSHHGEGTTTTRTACTDTGYVCYGYERGHTSYCQEWAADSVCDGEGSCLSPASCFNGGSPSGVGGPHCFNIDASTEEQCLESSSCAPSVAGLPASSSAGSSRHCENSVVHQGVRYATLDATVKESSAVGCQDDFLALPDGWEIAPQDESAVAVTAGWPWGTHLLVYSDGGQRYTNNEDYDSPGGVTRSPAVHESSAKDGQDAAGMPRPQTQQNICESWYPHQSGLAI